MKFSLETKLFKDAVAAVMPAVKANAIGAMQGLLIEASKDKLVLTAANAETAIRNILPVTDTTYTCDEEGTVLVNAQNLSQFLSSFVGAETTLSKKSKINLTDGETKFSMAEYNVPDFPNIDFSLPKAKIDMKGEDLKSIVKKTCFAVSKDKDMSRPVLKGVNFIYANDVLTCVGTDSFRLSQYKVGMPFNGSDVNVTVPASVLKTIAKIAADDADIKLCLDVKYAVVSIGDNLLIRTSLVNSRYPDVTRLIPTTFATTFKVARKELENACSQAKFFKEGTAEGIIHLEISETDGVRVYAKNDAIGDFEKVLDTAEVSGNPMKIAFSPAYMEDALGCFSGDSVDVKFKGDTAPLIIVDDNEPNLVELMLPIRSYD